MAEPGALIGFAGPPRDRRPRIKKELPKGFQRSEFLVEKGQVDLLVKRDEMRHELGRLLAYGVGGDPTAVPREEVAAAGDEG